MIELLTMAGGAAFIWAFPGMSALFMFLAAGLRWWVTAAAWIVLLCATFAIFPGLVDDHGPKPFDSAKDPMDISEYQAHRNGTLLDNLSVTNGIGIAILAVATMGLPGVSPGLTYARVALWMLLAGFWSAGLIGRYFHIEIGLLGTSLPVALLAHVLYSFTHGPSLRNWRQRRRLAKTAVETPAEIELKQHTAIILFGTAVDSLSNFSWDEMLSAAYAARREGKHVSDQAIASLEALRDGKWSRLELADYWNEALEDKMRRTSAYSITWVHRAYPAYPVRPIPLAVV